MSQGIHPRKGPCVIFLAKKRSLRQTKENNGAVSGTALPLPATAMPLPTTTTASALPFALPATAVPLPGTATATAWHCHCHCLALSMPGPSLPKMEVRGTRPMQTMPHMHYLYSSHKMVPPLSPKVFQGDFNQSC